MSKDNGKSDRRKTDKKRKHWVIKVFFITFIIAYFFSIFSDAFVRKLDNLYLALGTILVIILIGVVFDTIGIAVTAASEVPFVSMASKRIRGAAQAIQLIKNADRVSNFCNDVVGDICGIISGAAGGILVIKVHSSLHMSVEQSFLSIIFSSLIAALTVGGKALGKTVAIQKSQNIIYSVGYFLSFFTVNRRYKKIPSKAREGKEKLK